ncbi:probable RNA-dependent RNA polymerase 1 [Tanacetum coccineum]
MPAEENREIITAMLSCGYQLTKERTGLFDDAGSFSCYMKCVSRQPYLFLKRKKQKVHDGRVVVAKNPCLHNGDEVKQYFAYYTIHDNLVLIANTHTVDADKETEKARHEKCKHLAELFTTAVNSTKTGKMAQIPPTHRVSHYPRFMQKLFDTVVEDTVASKSFRPGEAYNRDMGQGSRSPKSMMKYYGIKTE